MQFVQMAARTLYTLEVDVSNVMTTREAAERMEEAVKQAQYPSGSRDIVQVIARHAAHAAFHLRKRGPAPSCTAPRIAAPEPDAAAPSARIGH